MITLILLGTFLFFIFMGVCLAFWDKLPEKHTAVEEDGVTYYIEKESTMYNGKRKKHPRDVMGMIIGIVLVVYIVGMVSSVVILNETQRNKLINNNEIVVSKVYIDTGGFNEYDVVTIYYDKEKDEYYYLKHHLFNPVKMYEKKILSKEFVDIQLKEQEYFSEISK